jgi:hypothetical protein
MFWCGVIALLIRPVWREPVNLALEFELGCERAIAKKLNIYVRACSLNSPNPSALADFMQRC